MVRLITDFTSVQFLAACVFVMSALRSVLAKGSHDLENINPFAPALLRFVDVDTALPSLMLRGGSLRTGFYENMTDTDDFFEAAASLANQHSTRDHILKNQVVVQPSPKPYNGFRRRIPSLQRFPKFGRNNGYDDNDQCLSYTDILQCKFPGGVRSGIFERNNNNNGKFSNDDQGYGDNIFSSREPPTARSGKMEGTQKLSHSPVIYQYFGRSRMRGNPSQSVHFIVIGPNVDHWRAVCQILASRGFNAIACERVLDDKKSDPSKDSPNLVLDILDALRWNRAVLVGCDKEAILAMETAMMLAPDRVAGMVLSGDLAEASRVASEAGVNVLDGFLRRILDCPFLIVWDGDSPSVVSGSSASDAIASDSDSTCQILGGGTAPHRTKAEQFAWVLTRFVEEKIELPSQRTPRIGGGERRQPGLTQRQTDGQNILRLINLPFGVNTLVSPEGRLLLGRAMAAAIFYITVMKVAVIQYGILRAGLAGLKSKYDSVDAVVKRIFQATGAFIVNYGYIPRLFKVKKAADDDDDDGPSPQRQERAEENIDEEASDSEEEPEDLIDDSNPDDTSDNDEPEDHDTSEDISPREDSERPRFKPFFFLDSVVT